MSKNTVISLSNVSKYYKLYPSPKVRLIEAIHPLGKKYHSEFYALRDISLNVGGSEVLGVVGRNGCGKSTLLKVISGVLQPSSGTASINGKITALLELGTQLNPEFSGLENIRFACGINNLEQDRVEEFQEEVISFSELGEFIHQPVKHYSSGMKARLAFALATNVNPDILILDEVLSVGDIKFQRKCYERIEQFRDAGRTILFVSHNSNSVNMFCNRAVLMNGGKIVKEGEPKYITEEYHKLLFGAAQSRISHKPDVKKNKESKEESNTPKVNNEPAVDSFKVSINRVEDEALKSIVRYGNRDAEIIDFGILDCKGNKTTSLKSGQTYTFFSVAYLHKSLSNIDFGFAIRDVKGVLLFYYNTYGKQTAAKIKLKEKDTVESRITIDMHLAPGKYFLTHGVREDQVTICDRLMDVLLFNVTSDWLIDLGGLVCLYPRNLMKEKI